MTDNEFRHAFLEGCMGKEDRAIAERLRVSIPTIDRWKRGKNLPHARLRDSVLRALRPD